MSKKKSHKKIEKTALSGFEAHEGTDRVMTKAQASCNHSTDSTVKSMRVKSLLGYVKTHALMFGMLSFLVLGVAGAGLKYLDEAAKRETAVRAANRNRYFQREESVLDKINPFMPAPQMTPAPQLSKEYVYAGSRLLAVEDANATAAPPADLAVWRPSSGIWYVLGGPGSQQTFYQWGLAGDIPVPGDYDGDGKTDFAVFRPSDNDWWIMQSSNNVYYQVHFGASGDKPAQADFDGDGKTDKALFRPSNGTWYVQRSSDSGYSVYQFGVSTDTPAPADFDGDGKADTVVWRNSDQQFYIRTGETNYETVFMGVSSTQPVNSDYDGDGRADYALRSGADWIIRNSSSSQVETVGWEQAGDLAVQNDYDGDGKTDIAVWRNSNGTWYIRQSGSNGSLRQVQWGLAGDIPVPAYYRR